MARTRLLLAVMVACSALVTIALVTIAGDRSDARDGGGSGFAGASIAAGTPARAFALRDQDGRLVRLAGERGRVVVLTFLYSTCQDTCPITAQQIRGALDQLGHDVPTLAVSVDPAGDTAARAKRFLLEQKLTARMRFLLGTRAQLAPIWKAYGIQPQGDGYEHTTHVFVLDKLGRPRVGFPVDHLTPEALAHDIRRLEREPA
jgi:protein SCO1/2